MKHIPLNDTPRFTDMWAIVDDEDFERAIAHIWSPYQPDGRRTIYARGWMQGKTVRMHCFLLGIKGLDHINGDGLDNRRSNLRIATIRQNSWNTRSHLDSLSQFKGVRWNRGKWAATIQGQHIGQFTDERDAALAYDREASKRFGEFARLNFPELGTPPTDGRTRVRA